MDKLRNIIEKTEKLLSKDGIAKYSVVVSESEKREFNADNGSFSLFRTLFNNNISVTVFNGQKQGIVAGNDFTDAGIEATVAGAVATCNASSDDPAKDFAPNQGKECFNQGSYEPELDLFFNRTKELSDTISKEYPKIKVMLMVASHDKRHSIYMNTNGTEFERYCGSYSLMVEFAANDGTKTTGIDAFGFETLDLSIPFIEQANARQRLENCIRQLEVTRIPDKFEGTVILTPDCLGNFLGMTLSNYASDGVILDNTSLWIDKLDTQVADSKVSVTLTSKDPRLVCPPCYNADGFKCEDVPVIENGILKNFVINLYTANKTGKKVAKAANILVVKNGKDKLEDMIKSVKKGLLVGSFSGGHPQTNGEFSGVAKNSFYIEDGKIQGAVMETMINGNLGEMLKNVSAVSEEVICDGNSVLPYMAFNGIVISGK